MRFHAPAYSNKYSGFNLCFPVAIATISTSPPRFSRSRLKGFDCDTSSSSPLDWLASIALREQRKSSAPSSGKPSSG